MATSVVKPIDSSLVITNKEDWEIRNVEGLVVAGLLEADAMGEKNPVAGEYGTPFKLVHLTGMVPGCGE